MLRLGPYVALAAALACGSPKATTDAGHLPGLISPDGGNGGAGLQDGGYPFWVWAPNAKAASVALDGGTWPLISDGDGGFLGFAPAALGQQYRFLLELPDGGLLTRTDPRAPLVGSDPGRHEPPGILYDPASYAWGSNDYVPPTARHAVIYELHVGTFNDPSGLGLGTYASAAQKLPDLAELGINLIELMPIAEFPGPYSWGYNTTYPFAACRAYGSPADLQALIDQAHALGIGVILDVVFNHFGLDSQLTPSLSMWCFDGFCDGGGIYFDPEPATPFGPRPSYGVPQVHDLILDALAYWLSNYRADGYRWDSAVYTRTVNGESTGTPIPAGARVMKDATFAVHAQDPSALMIAEDLQGWAAITEPVDPPSIDVYDSGYGFDAQWDNGFFSEVKSLVTAPSDAKRNIAGLVGPLTAGAPMTRVVYSEDHDEVSPQNGPDNLRLPALVGLADGGYLAERLCGLGLAAVMTAPAVPMLFMGQELLESLPFPFSPGPAVNWQNEQTYAGFRQEIHDLIAVRTNAANETRGLTSNNTQILSAANTHGSAASPAIAFRRYVQGGPGDDTVVVMNWSEKPQTLTVGFALPGAWHVRFNSDDQTYSPAFGGSSSADVQASGPPADGQPQSGQVPVGAYSTVILSQ